MQKVISIVLFSLLFSFSPVSHGEKFSVVFLNPGYPAENTTGYFWTNVTEFMQAAADDLDIQLTTIYAYRNHILMKSLVEEILRHDPDYVILVNEKGIAVNIAKQIAQHKVAIFMLLNDLDKAALNALSAEDKGFIVGSVTPDNYKAGKKLLQRLVAQGDSLHSSGESVCTQKILALQGDYSTPASIAREQGLKDGLLALPKLALVDSSVANWSKQQAYQKVKGIMQRSRIDIIWAANDAMAFGAKKAVKEANLDYPVVIGGINWDVNDEQFPLDISFGGHVTLGAKAMTMLYDIHHQQLPVEQRHINIDIFESSENAAFLPFVDKLKDKRFAGYDFTLFTGKTGNKRQFTIENLTDSYQ
ncbi:ABC transporter substrate-binding protein [Litorilituus sediminis]|uniref:Sugar ABC transporter substrate-binding protein n=1 Tax=Litorilituus sediminis TaxID=718192 RepID=A0A4P6P6P9_9GAMM|nr:ABC transporter substrate-binding protein [Litorilituus sediminis]QBG37174.1 sugar ABC transporter substrate-binding protein [Litorilituus sediminis]